jgi:hypothetical protein
MSPGACETVNAAGSVNAWYNLSLEGPITFEFREPDPAVRDKIH